MLITYNAPAGVTSVNLPDGSIAVVKNGQITVDAKWRNELEAAGCSGQTDTDRLARWVTDLSTGIVKNSGVGGMLMTPTAFAVKVAFGVLGQSNEQGNTKYLDANGNWVWASAAAPSQGIYEPIKLNTAGFGSMFTAVAELLSADGVKVDLHNGSVGGISIPLDCCGWVNLGGRSNSTAYRGKRTSLGAGDPGHRGYMISVNNATWEATTGNKHLAFYADQSNPVTVNGAAYYSDPGSIIQETNLKTAATPPTFPGSPVVGNTVVDGGITWTCTATGALVADATGIHILRYNEDGFDPYGIALRLRNSVMSSRVAPDKRFVYLQNGQADAGIAGAAYKVGLREMVRFFGQSPYLIQAIVGLSIYYPAQTQASWDALETEISGGGLASSPNYSGSNLTSALTGLGYHMATPGNGITSFGYYYGQSLYRSFGTNTVGMLQPSDPHVTLFGMNQCAAALAPTLSKIFRNSAT